MKNEIGLRDAKIIDVALGYLHTIVLVEWYKILMIKYIFKL